MIPCRCCQIADCGCGLFLGNLLACDHHHVQRVCHVGHRDQPPLCQHCLRHGFDVEWLERDVLTESAIDTVARAAAGTDPLLLHCSAGLGRSATLMIVAMVVRGADPWQAMATIARAMWEQYAIPHAPHWHSQSLNVVLRWYDQP